MFVAFLNWLGVNYTCCFSNKYLAEHPPHKYSLLGLLKMLSDYGIKNVRIRVKDKGNDIFSIEILFIVHIDSDFVAA